MADAAEVRPTIVLRCHHCSMSVGTAAQPLRFVGMFKASLFDRMPAARDGVIRLHEVRKKCSHCGWVNLFHPPHLAGGDAPSWRDVSLKGA